MAQITTATIKKVWYATEDSTWQSVIAGLNYLYEVEEITWDEYESIEYAVKKMVELESDFPDSYGELYEYLDLYM